MDRVLLIIDDIQYNRQVEVSLRKVGFEVESVNNEFNVNEPLLSFNPDYIIVRGNSSRLSVLNVGKKLKESSIAHNTKIILVFPEKFEVSSDDLFRMRADLVLNDPISTLRLVLYLISLIGQDGEFMKEKLLKFAVTDAQFRASEQQILRHAGITIDSEIEILSNTEVSSLISASQLLNPPGSKPPPSGIMVTPGEKFELGGVTIIKEDSEDAGKVMAFAPPQEPITHGDVKIFKNEKNLLSSEKAEDYATSEETRLRLDEEIKQSEDELPLRIDSYNRAIKSVDQDLKIGLKKRQTRKEFNQLHKDLIESHKTDKNTEDDLDRERIEFTNALFKKK